MLNFLFRGLLTFNATSLLVIIFLVKEGIKITKIFPILEDILWLINLPNFISYIIYVIVILLLTWLSLYLSSKLGKDEFKIGEITNIEHANNSFLPSYLGYFFVALSINNLETLFFIYIVIFIFTFLSQALYFNPLFLIFGYNFYNVTNKNGISFFLISQDELKDPNMTKLKVNRINNYTYIDGGK